MAGAFGDIGAMTARLKRRGANVCRCAHPAARADDPGMKRLHFGAVICGVFVDQLGSFAMGAVIAVLVAGSVAAGGRDAGMLNLVQALYEVSCIGFGVAGGFTAAQLARRSMLVHGIATGIASLGVSTALGIAMDQEMFDARGIFFAVVALLAGSLGGWLASVIIGNRPHPARG